MSLAKRLSSVNAVRSNLGCATCEWIETLSPEDREALNEWIDGKMSISQLHEIAISNEDNPLPVSDSAFRNHIRRHHNRAGE